MPQSLTSHAEFVLESLVRANIATVARNLGAIDRVIAGEAPREVVRR